MRLRVATVGTDGGSRASDGGSRPSVGREAAERASRPSAAPAALVLWTAVTWLAVALAVDLVVTRFLLRLAVFVPKSELAAAVVGPVARLGAVVENLVALLALAVLGLLVGAAVSRGHGPTTLAPPSSVVWRIGLAATIVVAVGGLALLVAPPDPIVVAGLGASLVVGVLGFGPAALVGRTRLEALGLGLLAGSLLATGLGRGLAAGSILAPGVLVSQAGAAAFDPGHASPALLAVLGGQLAFAAGALAVGLAGLRASGGRRTGWRWLLLGILVSAVALVAVGRAPTTSGMLVIWTLGLSGVVPLGFVAAGLGLVVAGLGRSLTVDRRRALGPTLIVLAGATPAASSLVLAALLGLALSGARSDVEDVR
ncbi:MAG TPA: hypothetical protein VNO86_05945 [Candidatus Binatia bacterium]|nr:hypothetical protein [Candidatus Binatia bacterium]